jgi:hypothetical protein
VPQIETIERNKCAISGMEDLEVIDVMPRFPIYMGCVDTPETDDVFVDAIWSISKSSGVIQLQRLIPLNLLYQEQHASGVVGDIWMQHHRAFADFLQQQKPLSVFEIGGAHGILATEYMKQQTIEWVILEPNPAPIGGCPANFVKGFFTGKEDIPVGKPTIVHSHVFEHMYDPREFIKGLSESMDVGQDMVFSIPNMQEMLRRGYTNCLNFEHSVFLTEDAVDGLLTEFGFEVKTKKLFRQDHSIFYSVSKSKIFTVSKSDFFNHYETNVVIYANYKNRYSDLIRNFNNVLTELPTDRKIFLFGAHIFSQYLIFNGLDASRIHCILDNDLNKQNHRMYGTKFTVNSPTVLVDEKEPIVILCAGVYNEEIKSAIVNNINAKTIFLEDVCSVDSELLRIEIK